MTTESLNTFWNLHKSGSFVIPNPWDIGTSIFLQQLGFKALATTSAGVSFTKGVPDEIGRLSLEEILTNIRDIVTATSLPVNADFQNGYANTLEELAENVKKCISTGVAGLSIEDATGNKKYPLYDKKIAVERIRTTRKVINDSNIPVLLTARCEAWLVCDATPFETALDRLVAYADAGADCLYAPGVTNNREIEKIVTSVAPKPVNVLMSSAIDNLSVSRLTDLGVRRISVGSVLNRIAWGAFIKASKDLVQRGSPALFEEAASFSELNKIFDS
ncbi:oxaloacetate decarboxylase [Candidatus Uabimicrobium sp. HlEnr_7]|uniref:isocitrate lyase/PEP mutase family protein n=1 Tax=Candidatus Uabimicrobium helgolandensis TaxID=3095367 RepID=UPI003556267B